MEKVASASGGIGRGAAFAVAALFGFAAFGEITWTLGYPLPSFLGETVKYGEGVVTSHEGFRGDAQRFSVSAPIRPGSSGGPVFNAEGKVCGIMTSTLKTKLVFDANGHSSPESNFAVKVGFVRALLEKHGISCDRADARPLPENRPDAVEEAARAVILFHAAESMNESKKD